jgi:hypothetical protein
VSNSEAATRTVRQRFSLGYVAFVGVMGALSLVLVGCGGSKAGSHKSDTSTAGKTAVASGVPGAAAAAITTSYVRFFDPKVAESERVGLIQDGTAFSQAMAAQAKSPFAKAASVKVIKVTVTSAKRATVVYTILLSGSPVLSNQTGYAVNEGGKWKVAGQTFCDLLAVEISPPAVCKMAPATTLPS